MLASSGEKHGPRIPGQLQSCPNFEEQAVSVFTLGLYFTLSGLGSALDSDGDLLMSLLFGFEMGMSLHLALLGVHMLPAGLARPSKGSHDIPTDVDSQHLLLKLGLGMQFGLGL